MLIRSASGVRRRLGSRDVCGHGGEVIADAFRDGVTGRAFCQGLRKGVFCSTTCLTRVLAPMIY
eukprot:7759426-Lingulodinium_polyedra.AAC.1